MKYWKKCLLALLTAAMMTSSLTGCSIGKNDTDSKTATQDSDNTSEKNKKHKQYYFRTSGESFEVYNGTDFEKMYIKGVNIGLGKPGAYPGELAITKEEYMDWFRKISDMGANSIRVYTVMKPCFYEALYEYNQKSSKKLYFFQGLWYDEDVLSKTQDAYTIFDEAVADAKHLVDVIHGHADIKKQAGKAYGKYRYDVSKYAIGWILGIESDAVMVSNTNSKNSDKTKYKGKYISTVDGATPYEVFMCSLGDSTISYEMDHYNMQRPVSWSNWPTADMLEHKNEPDWENEDAIIINVENIKASDKFKAGVFASYHIYPYYPEFMMFDKKYRSYVDEDGKKNTYKAYLKDLIKHHTVPVLVAEYGVPSSRGCTHINTVTGFNQGGITEKEQGEMLASMAKDIRDTGYCGEIVFAWQDEWFKRTWNTMDYTDENRRPYWRDVQTSEQNFGLMEFIPGLNGASVVLDGDISEWEKKDEVSSSNGISVYAKSDVSYLYLMVKGDKIDFEKDRVVIPLDITPKSGSSFYENYKFNKKTDFVVDIQGKDNTHVKVQNYYSRYTFSFKKKDKAIETKGSDKKDSDIFVPIYMSLGKKIYLPEDKKYIPYRKYDTGKLRYGISDTSSKEYDSMSDFYYSDNAVEIRIPWGMLNFRDPSTKEIEDDFNVNGGLSGMNIDKIYIGACAGRKSAAMKSYTWDNWKKVEYSTRLKQSYYILKKCYETLD